MERKVNRIVLGISAILTILLNPLLAYMPAVAQEPTVADEGAIIEYSGDPNTAVIEVTVDIGMVEGDEDTPRLRIYGDGRLHVHFHPGMTNAGNYELFLDDTQVADILTSLSDNGLMTFDEQGAHRAKKALQEQRTRTTHAGSQIPLKHSSDGTRTTITINLALFRARGAGQPTISGFSRSISWYGIRSDAQNYPEIQEIANLATAAQELMGLCDTPGLRKTDN